MIEFELSSQQPDAARPAFPVTVIGLGGAGTNILDTIALEGLPGAQLVALNTDARALQSSMLGVKLQLGTDLTRGLGTGGDPDLGADAVRASAAEIREEIRGQKMVFLCTGLGGGTGSGAAPLVARMAREEGAFVVVFAVMPFAFEGRRRLRQAEEALTSLRAEADALITFDNDRLGEVVLPKKGIHEAFAAADKIVSQSLRAIINLVSAPGLIRIGMDELIAAVGRGDTRCLFGHGSSRGPHRVAEALATALKSPLLHKGQLRERGRSVLVHVCGGPQMTFAEVQELMHELNDGHLHEDARILFGTGVDATMGDQLSVTLLTSLSPEEVHPEKTPAAPTARTHAPHPAPPPQPATAVPQPAGDASPPSTPQPAPVIPQATAAIPQASAAIPQAAAAIPQAAAAIPQAAAASPIDHDSEIDDALPPPRSEAALDEDHGPAVEEWAPSHVRQGLTARMQAEGQSVADPAAVSHRPFHLRELAREKPASAPAPEPSRPQTSRPAGFKSWQREEERRDPNAPIEYENVGSVSEFEAPPPPAAPPAPAPDPEARPAKPPGRLSFLTTLGRGSRDAAPPAPPAPPVAADPPHTRNEQKTFDHTLRPLPSSRGRFDRAEPTIEDGEDLDVPTFMRRKQ
jgi:cell division protein FtsZ